MTTGPAWVPPSALVAWSLPARAAFLRAIERHGSHSQQQAASRIEELGAKLSQQHLSSLLSGELETPHGKPRKLNLVLAEAISQYLAEARITSLAELTNDTEADDVEDLSEIDSPGFITDGEPELGGRRAQLIDTLLQRLAGAGGQLNESEERIAAWISEVERFDPPLRLPKRVRDKIDLTD